MAQVPGKDLAAMLALVRAKKPRDPLPTVAERNHRDQLRIEAENIAKSIQFAARHLKEK
jgi:hypothetical protein